MASNQKSQRKYDRCRKSPQNSRYKMENRHGKSHIRRISQHLQRYGKDKQAIGTLMFYAQNVGLEATRKADALVKGL